VAANPPLRVLYVEDDRVAALLFVEALRDAPQFEVELAETGAEALELAARWSPDVLVVDANLPDTSGPALLSQLQALPGLAQVPAFICSADALLKGELAGMAVAFAGYWLKPVQRSTLLSDLGALAPIPRA